MKNTQYNFAVAILVFLAVPAAAGTIAKPHQPDPLLDGGPTSPCAAGADYAAGTDVQGRKVVPADVGATAVPVPDSITIPLAQNGHRSRVRPGMGVSAYVSLDGRPLTQLPSSPHPGPAPAVRTWLCAPCLQP